MTVLAPAGYLRPTSLTPEIRPGYTRFIWGVRPQRDSPETDTEPRVTGAILGRCKALRWRELRGDAQALQQARPTGGRSLRGAPQAALRAAECGAQEARRRKAPQEHQEHPQEQLVPAVRPALPRSSPAGPGMSPQPYLTRRSPQRRAPFRVRLGGLGVRPAAIEAAFRVACRSVAAGTDELAA